MVELVNTTEECTKLYDIIYNNRVKIAELRRDKIVARASAWENATGIADQKKDYVRSVVADIDEEISKLDAEIERAYNQLKLVGYQIGESRDG